MAVKDLEFYEQEIPAGESMKEFIEEEIAHVPRAPGELAERLAENNAASPADSGGDIDAEWEDVNDSGAESVFGHNPTPDQSDVEENAHAMGIDYQDNEPIDVLRKLEKRDRDRYELNENSKSTDDMI
ncbi:MAG: hypothetical protein H7070_15885 [Saprospiraceae bacterium]|nr:hypothetical protein [Pyrinomonadaceae bacterium]